MRRKGLKFTTLTQCMLVGTRSFRFPYDVFLHCLQSSGDDITKSNAPMGTPTARWANDLVKVVGTKLGTGRCGDT